MRKRGGQGERERERGREREREREGGREGGGREGSWVVGELAGSVHGTCREKVQQERAEELGGLGLCVGGFRV